jgi:hypothetical protein
LALATVIAVIVTVRLARTDRKRDDDRRREDRERDAELRRQDRECEDQLRREADEKWEARLRAEQRQREDDDAQQQVFVESRPGGPLSQPQRAVTTGDRITHQIIVTTSAAYPIKWVDAQIAHRANSGLSIVGPGWKFGPAVLENGQVRYTCGAHVPGQLVDPAPIVRFADRNGNLYYSYQGYTRRFSQSTEFHEAASEIDKWVRTGPKPDEIAT